MNRIFVLLNELVLIARCLISVEMLSFYAGAQSVYMYIMGRNKHQIDLDFAYLFDIGRIVSVG